MPFTLSRYRRPYRRPAYRSRFKRFSYAKRTYRRPFNRRFRRFTNYYTVAENLGQGVGNVRVAYPKMGYVKMTHKTYPNLVRYVKVEVAPNFGNDWAYTTFDSAKYAQFLASRKSYRGAVPVVVD